MGTGPAQPRRTRTEERSPRGGGWDEPSPRTAGAPAAGNARCPRALRSRHRRSPGGFDLPDPKQNARQRGRSRVPRLGRPADDARSGPAPRRTRRDRHHPVDESPGSFHGGRGPSGSGGMGRCHGHLRSSSIGPLSSPALGTPPFSRRTAGHGRSGGTRPDRTGSRTGIDAFHPPSQTEIRRAGPSRGTEPRPPTPPVPGTVESGGAAWLTRATADLQEAEGPSPELFFGAELELLDTRIYRVGRYQLDEILVRVRSNPLGDGVGQVGWIDLDDTSFRRRPEYKTRPENEAFPTG